MNDGMHWRTSATDPLRIDSVAVPGTTARIGMTLCPGKIYPWGRHGAWRRDLETDLAAVADWGATTLISLIEDHEFEELGVTRLPEMARALNLDWRHWPVTDRQAPDARLEAAWTRDIAGIVKRLKTGHSLVLHCMGGLGRTGTIAARFLILFGLTPMAAIERVRSQRRGAIETGNQLQHVLSADEAGLTHYARDSM